MIEANDMTAEGSMIPMALKAPEGPVLTCRNGFVGLSPIEERGARTQQVAPGVVTLRQKASLLPLEVIVPDENYLYRRGDIVYLPGEVTGHVWSGQVFEIGSDRFILAPVNLIRMRRTP